MGKKNWWYLFQWRETEHHDIHQDRGTEKEEHYEDLYLNMPAEEIAILTYPLEKLEKDLKTKGWRHGKTGHKKLLDVLNWDKDEEPVPDALWKNKSIKRVHEPAELFKNGNTKKSSYRLEFQGLWIREDELARRAGIIMAYYQVMRSLWGRQWGLPEKWEGDWETPPNELVAINDYRAGWVHDYFALDYLQSVFVRVKELPEAADLSGKVPTWNDSFNIEPALPSEEHATVLTLETTEEIEADIERTEKIIKNIKKKKKKEDMFNMAMDTLESVHVDEDAEDPGEEVWETLSETVIRKLKEHEEPPKKPKQTKLTRKMKKLGADPESEVHLTVSTSGDNMYGRGEPWKDDLVEAALDSVCDIILQPAMTEGDFFEELFEFMHGWGNLLAECRGYDDKELSKCSWSEMERAVSYALQKCMLDNYSGGLNGLLFDSMLNQYDYKRGFGEVWVTVKVKAKILYKWGDQFNTYGAEKIEFKDEDGDWISFKG